MLNDDDFISNQVEERTVELGDGTKRVLYFLQLPNTAFERYFTWSSSADENVAAAASCKLLAMGLCDPDGKPAMDAEKVARIKPQIKARLFAELLDVNGYKKPAAASAGNA